MHDRRLRWPVSRALPEWAQGQVIQAVRRRAKYLVIQLERGYLLLHLGMSGSLLILPESTALDTHDHFDMILIRSGHCASTIRAASAACITAREYRRAHPAAQPGAGALGQEFD